MDDETKQLIVQTARNVEGLMKTVGCLETGMGGLASDVSTLKEDVSALKTDVSTLKSDVSTLKSDVSTLKSDVSTLTSDVATLKDDVSVLQTDVSTLKDDVRTLTLRSDVLEFNFDEMHADMDLGFSLANDSFEKLTRHIDGFAAQSLRMNQELAAGLHRDDRLEDRILRLEQRAGYGR